MRMTLLKITLFLIVEVGLFVLSTLLFNLLAYCLGKDFDKWIDLALIKFFIMLLTDDSVYINAVEYLAIMGGAILAFIFPTLLFEQLKINKPKKINNESSMHSIR